MRPDRRFRTICFISAPPRHYTPIWGRGFLVFDLLLAERQRVEIDYCPKCRGVWLDRGELDVLIERSSPFLRGPFHFGTLHPMDLALCLASGTAGSLWFEILKVIRLRGQQIAPLG